MGSKEEEEERASAGLAAAAVSFPRDGVCSVSLFTSIGSRWSGAEQTSSGMCVNSAAICLAGHFDHRQPNLDCDAAGFVS